MDYRSDVCIVCNEKAFEKIKATGALTQEHLKPDEIRRNNNNDYGIIYDGVKWCDLYEEIKKVEEALDSLKAKEGEYYNFTRLGEDDSDVETRYNDMDYIPSIVRQIDVTEFIDAEQIEL